MARTYDTSSNPTVEIRDITDIIKPDYMSYAVALYLRSIPNAIDGLKPVQRRILYTMFINKIFGFEKCVSIVGQTAQLVTTGDISIYDALVLLGQVDRVRYPLIVSQGNFGFLNSSTLNSPAAARYTEAHLSEYARDFYFTEDIMFADMIENYNGKLKEPTVLPTLLPMAYIQGSNGIAAGYRNYMLPHNLHKLADCYIKFLEEKNKTVSDFSKLETYITKHLKIDLNKNKSKIIRESATGLKTGQGQVVMQGTFHTEPSKYGRTKIVVTELPYITSPETFRDNFKAKMGKEIPALIHGDISDESNSEGIRVVIECKRDTNIDVVVEFIKLKTNFTAAFNYSSIYIHEARAKRMGVLDVFYTHYTFKVENLTKYFNHNIKNLKFKYLCVSSAELILGNKTNRDEFIKMVTESKKEAVYKLLNKKYNFDTDVVDYLLSRTFSSLSNKVENIVKEKLELEKDLKVFEDKLRDIDTYLINEIKTKVKKYK